MTQQTFDIVGNNAFFRNLEVSTINGEVYGGGGGGTPTNILYARELVCPDGTTGLQIRNESTPLITADIHFEAGGSRRWTIDGQWGTLIPATDYGAGIGSTSNRLSAVYARDITFMGNLQCRSADNQWGGSFQYIGGGGAIIFQKLSSEPPSYGTGGAYLYFRDGTNANTMKLVVKAGQSGAETIVLDNIPI